MTTQIDLSRDDRTVARSATKAALRGSRARRFAGVIAVAGLAAGITLGAASTANADVVVDWNAAIINRSLPEFRGQTLADIAMHDALNAIDRRYEPRFVDTHAAPGTTPLLIAACPVAGLRCTTTGRTGFSSSRTTGRSAGTLR